jgi:poly-gamma-glutamate synthesis protein (capsule biosynthesis protein)
MRIRMYRREFLFSAGKMLALLMPPLLQSHGSAARGAGDSSPVTLFLGGDVMTGRGIDQVMPHPSDPEIHESYIKDARRYVALAEEANGPIPRPVEFSYIWGEALEILERVAPDVRIVNLETAVTRSDDHWPGKGINYRMHPRNVPCLSTAGIDCWALANNHILDWGYSGLAETLITLKTAGLRFAGAGRDLQEAEAPVILELPGKGRVIVFSCGTVSSGIAPEWAATAEKAGVFFLESLLDTGVERIVRGVAEVKQDRDLVVVSIHWGANWGYRLPRLHREFAHRLIDEAGVDVIHGHSSHHPLGIEIYRNKPILYGCGDLLNDYEGIGGYEEFRSDLALMYLPTLDPITGGLLRLEMVPLRMHRFQVVRAPQQDVEWLGETLSRVSRPLGSRVELGKDRTLTLRWKPESSTS